MTGGAMLRDFSRGGETPLRGVGDCPRRVVNRRNDCPTLKMITESFTRVVIFSVGYTQIGKAKLWCRKIDTTGIRNVAELYDLIQNKVDISLLSFDYDIIF